jgi:dihydrofolate reductase
MKRISIIVAIAENNAIGLNNQLLWHLSEDLKRFKRLTTGHTVVMGKKTYESLPFRPLSNRRNVVISDVPDDRIEGCVMAYSIQEAIEKMEDGKENFVIGGGSIYRQFFDLADTLYITHVKQSFEADTFFPSIDPDQWELVSTELHHPDEKNPYPYEFQIYTKINNK